MLAAPMIMPALEPASPTSPTSSCLTLSLPLVFHSAVASVPLASKGNQGEDAYFTTPSAMGVADGVGGWGLIGIDAGLYSRQLMEFARECVTTATTSSSSSSVRALGPNDIMQQAYNAMPKTIIGTTTATICTLEKGALRVSNLGDSGVLVLRFNPTTWSWTPVMRTREQVHYFNCPLQMGTDAGDFPCDADSYEFAVQENDLILLATDGVFDNLFDDDIAACVTPHMNIVHNQFNVAEAANAVALAAISASQNTSIQTPFSKGANQHLMPHQGGKVDDVTCVLGLVVFDAYRSMTLEQVASSPVGDENVMMTPNNRRP